MVACLPDLRTACTPVCRNCGQDLVEQDDPPDTGRGRSYWQRTCGCVIEPEPEKDFGFTAEEVSKFAALVAARGFDIDRDFGLHLMNSLADTGSKVVLGLPAGDIVITAREAGDAIGRRLGPSR
jgi:hypothetical protein